MDEKVIGIDIGRDAVAAVLIVTARGERRVAAYARTVLHERDPWSGLSETLDSLRAQADIAGAVYVAALPDKYLSYRHITLPFGDRRKIEKIITYELDPLLPFSPEEAIIDFFLLDEDMQSTGGEGVGVLAAVVPKVRLTEMLAGCTGSGLNPEIITSRGLAAASVLSAYEDTAFWVEIEGEEVVSALVEKGKVRLVRSFPVGKSLENGLDSVCQGLRQTLLAYEEDTGRSWASIPVFIAGEKTQDKTFARALERQFGAGPRVMDVVEGLGLVHNGRPDHNWTPGTFEVALCLALLKSVRKDYLNFRRAEFSSTGKWRQYSNRMFKIAIFVGLIVLLWFAGVFYDIYHSRQKISALRERQAAVFQDCCPNIPVSAMSLDRMRSELIALRQESGMPENISRKVYCIEILHDISRLMPAKVDAVVSRLVIGTSDAVISGDTDAFNAVDAIQNRLRESRFFKKIDISSATMDKTDKRVHFKLRVELL